MNAEILAVGTELLLGDIVNTNAQYIAVELANLGIGVQHQVVVGDNPQRLKDAIALSLSRSDILITTGGLGPTCDDITKETVAEVLGLPMKLNDESLDRIESFFKKLGREMTENNRKQAMLPEGSVVFQNDWGTAPACAVEKDGKIVILLPGPPREMKPIFENLVKPYLQKFSNSVIASVNLRIFGSGESAVESECSDLMQGENPTLAPYAKDGEVLLRITGKAISKDEALKLCEPLEKEIRRRLGDKVYGRDVDSLQQVVVQILAKQKKQLALAESCTGGYIAKRITEISGSSEVFECGVVSYANRIKHQLLGVREDTLAEFGAVSEQVAAQMAEGVRKLAGADIGVGVTGIAGPGGGTPEKPVGLVYIGISDGEKCYVRKLLSGRGGQERELTRYVSASNALDMVRRLALGLPMTGETHEVSL